MLALTAIPLMGAVGVAVDFSRANATRTAFQAALDSTALALSKQAATQTKEALQATATEKFNALFSRPDATNVAVTAEYSGTAGSKLVLSATATVATNFLGVLGYSSIDIGASATSTWGNTRLRVALALDNTGSMASDDKMTALKTASKNLLAQLQAAATNAEDVYVSVVPFNKDVNMGAGNYDKEWVRWDLWEAENGTCSKSRYHSQHRCVSNGHTWTPASHADWNGCVTDRDQNFDTTNDAPVADATLYPAEQYGSCPAAIIGLTNNWTDLGAKIDAMQPAGNTNQAIGLQAAWQTLTAAPFTVPAMDPNYKYTQVIILLTDGLNTENRWYDSASPINARQQKTCDNAKAAGIVLYTVQVSTGGDPESALLKNCASDTSKFYMLTSATQIVTTFSQIGTALSNLRIAM